MCANSHTFFINPCHIYKIDIQSFLTQHSLILKYTKVMLLFLFNIWKFEIAPLKLFIVIRKSVHMGTLLII